MPFCSDYISVPCRVMSGSDSVVPGQTSRHRATSMIVWPLLSVGEHLVVATINQSVSVTAGSRIDHGRPDDQWVGLTVSGGDGDREPRPRTPRHAAGRAAGHLGGTLPSKG